MELGTAIRKDFPIFSEFKEKNLVYLDSAATSLKPRVVLDAMQEYHEKYSVNVHRGAYALAERATAAYEDARKTIARFIGAARAEEIVFTRNATEALNLVAYRYAGTFLKEGDGVLLTEMEHHSNLVPWQQVARAKGIKLFFMEVDPADGELVWGPEFFLNYLKSRQIKMISLTHVSNVLGAVNPVTEIVRKAHDVGVVVAVDGSQSAPHLPVDVQELGADFFAFSGHKMLGPTGIGILWGRYELLEKMPPFITGGEMVEDVFLDRSIFLAPPHRFEAGTPHISGAIGLAAAVRYLEGIGMENVHNYEQNLLAYAWGKLVKLPGIHLLGPRDLSRRNGLIAFTFASVHPHDVASFLDEQGIMIRAGDHCARPLHRKLKIPASSRMSFHIYNDKDDIDRAVEALERMVKVFGK